MPPSPPSRPDQTPDPLPDAAAVPPGALAAALLDASEWFNQRLVERLEARGWPALSRTRSLLFRHLQAGVDRPAGLARALDITRQSTQKLLEGLEADGLVLRRADPDDARAQRVAVTDRGRALVADAGAILRDLEAEFAERIGDDHLWALRQALGRAAPGPGPGGLG